MGQTPLELKTSDGFTLAADFTEPDEPRAWTIMCHGISSHKKEYLDMFDVSADLLDKKRIATLKFDFRGHGASSGNGEDFSIIGQLLDLEAAIEWIRNRAGRRNVPLFFSGVSFGGGAGLLFEKSRRVFSKISLFAPVVDYNASFLNPTTDWALSNFTCDCLSRAYIDNYLLLDGEFRVSHRLLKEMSLLDASKIIPQIDAPIQVFHGTEDSLIPCEITERSFTPSNDVDVHIMTGMGHGLYVAGDADGVSDESRIVQRKYYDSLVEFLCRDI